MNTSENPYLDSRMPLSRVKTDALVGVRLAREAWRARDPKGAANELGHVIEPSSVTTGADERQARVVQALKDFFRGNVRPGRKPKGRRRQGESARLL